jgi:hypothetical protein
MKCPNCGHSVFSNDTPSLATQSSGRSTAWDDVVSTGGVMACVMAGGYAIVWQSGVDAYWLAPAVGVIVGLGLNVLKLILDRPTVKKTSRRRGVTIDVRQKHPEDHHVQQWYFDAFPNARPSQLWRFSNAAINYNCNISRRAMKTYRVSETQYSVITKCLMERHWLDTVGDTDNARRILTRNGRAVLRGILASPDLASGADFRATSPPHHHPTTKLKI